MNKKSVWVVVCALLVFASIWAAGGMFRQNHGGDPQEITRQVRYSFTLKNTTNRLLKNASVWIYAPVKQTSHQTCKNIETSLPYELSTDCLGNQVLRFSPAHIAPFATEIITIKTDLDVLKRPGKTGCPDGCEDFLQPETRVESDHPDIAARAQSLKQSNDRDTAKAIYKWVADHIEYSGYLSRQQGALYALNHRKGDCTEYTDLFAALCRAADIPCRRVGGYICDKNTVLKPSGYHNWAEIYFNGKWRVADPQRRMFMKNESGYVALHIMGRQCANPMKNRNRFRVRGEGITVKMNS